MGMQNTSTVHILTRSMTVENISLEKFCGHKESFLYTV